MKKKKNKISCLSEKACKGHLKLKHINYKLKFKNKIITIPNIEVWECNQCGESFYTYETSKKIDLYKEYSGRLMVRLTPEIHWRLVGVARKHHRSLNQEINYLLENYLK